MGKVIAMFGAPRANENAELEQRYLIRCDCGRLFTARLDGHPETMYCPVCDEAKATQNSTSINTGNSLSDLAPQN